MYLVSDHILKLGLEERGLEINNLSKKTKPTKKLRGVEIPIDYSKL